MWCSIVSMMKRSKSCESSTDGGISRNSSICNRVDLYELYVAAVWKALDRAFQVGLREDMTHAHSTTSGSPLSSLPSPLSSPMTAPEFDPLDCSFHAAALTAYLEQAALCGSSDSLGE